MDTTLHLAILVATVCGIVWADYLGWRYFRGEVVTLDRRVVSRLHTFVWFGLVGMVLSGAYLAYDRVAYLSGLPSFWLKMAFVLLLIVNSFVIHWLMQRAFEKPFAALPRHEQFLLMLSGAASTLGWVGAALIGFGVL
ncbi:hypothetical protein KGO06_00920 [Patescibacteria group bacterium]|nr:hypothetical protein [Patescibacteria group bacterium]